MTAAFQPTKDANPRAKTRQTHEKLLENAASKPDQRIRGMRILLIEDDQNAAEFILKGLAEQGYVSDHARDGKDGLFLAASEKYDVMIIDRMLPGLDGLSIVKMLRATGNQVPAIFLTTMAGIDDRVEGLDAGADDYLVKPFAFSELLARIAALLRRPPISETKTVLRAADLEMDLLTRTVRRAGRAIDLQPQEFRLLEYLMRSEGRVVTRTMLLENVWDFHFDPQTSVVETHISRLRAKIDKGFGSDLLRTIRGVGYCLRENV
jgi:two-component system OmpR family response regulator